MLTVKLPSGESLELSDGATSLNAAEAISPALAKKAVAADINGKSADLSATLVDGDTVLILTEDNPKSLEILRHSAAHLMAQAVKNLFPEAMVAIGPVIEDGFYYDFDFERPFTPEDLGKIEVEMYRLSKEGIPVVRSEMGAEDAAVKFCELGENYKGEIIRDLVRDAGINTVSLYTQGNFTDLCRGPHVLNTAKIAYFKLLSVAGAYWRGDEKNRVLQRIYGTAFFSKKELDKHLAMLEEAKKRDHRKLGKELKLFMFEEEVGTGFPIYLPKGGVLRAVLEEFERKEHLRRGYEIVYCPILLKKEVWIKSGHYDNYGENMYFTEVDGAEYGIKPMNCVNHIVIYSSDLRSYRDLPIRLFELGHVHRHEKSGALHGLMRVRAFTQDDAHIFCREDQLYSEITQILNFVKDVMSLFNFEFKHILSTRPEKYIGSTENWDNATNALERALKENGIDYTINAGDGAFYGPKIDILLKDAIGRFWQCATIQCDFNLPERFHLSYIGEGGGRHRPVMLHRVILGSVDRFIGVLTEHFAGAFPLWLAPTQIRVMNITDEQAEYVSSVADKLAKAGFRIDADIRNEKIGFKIREAQLEKIPHMLILGGNEMKGGEVSLRLRSGENKNNLDLSFYIDIVSSLIAEKSLELWR
ncbi:MAG: threonine--tRNA ligase [Deferribacteraceae bacterium]|jgi:threonyl-tRNA synthetase|nr:threonine--tRNA ligase [Deferribacteraceae bacterium]